MTDRDRPSEQAGDPALHAEIARLNKIIQALMKRAESSAGMQGSAFNLFNTAITLENQVRRRTEELETALQANEKITRALRSSEHQLAEANQQLQQLNENLERQVAERTQALHDALHRAEAANRAKSTFLATMSHELRTPLNAILGLSYIAGQQAADPLLRTNLGKISGAGQNLLDLVNRILDIAKLDADKSEIESIDFSLHELLDECVRLPLQQSEAKGLKFIREIDPALPLSLRGDPSRLNQVLGNLLSNAIKFSDQGTVTLRVRLDDRRASGLLIRFEIEDEGIGIEAAHQATIFDTFEQADGSSTRKYGGAGLGLAICKHLARLMGGDIGVSSVLGKGSLFWFTARLERSTKPVDYAPADSTGQQAEPPAPASAQDDGEAAGDILDRIDGLLEQGDTAAIMLLDNHTATIRTALGTHFQAFAREIGQFAFDEARNTLHTARG